MTLPQINTKLQAQKDNFSIQLKNESLQDEFNYGYLLSKFVAFMHNWLGSGVQASCSF